MVTLYLTWSPWHYTGQNYGIGLMFLRRGGIDIPPDLKRWIYASFLLAFLMTAVVMHASPDASYSPADFDATRVLFVPLGIPKPVATGLLAPQGFQQPEQLLLDVALQPLRPFTGLVLALVGDEARDALEVRGHLGHELAGDHRAFFLDGGGDLVRARGERDLLA